MYIAWKIETDDFQVILKYSMLFHEGAGVRALSGVVHPGDEKILGRPYCTFLPKESFLYEQVGTGQGEMFLN